MFEHSNKTSESKNSGDIDQRQFSKRHVSVYGFILKRGMDGAIPDEASEYSQIPTQSMCWVIARLKKSGLVVATNRFRDTRLGRAARVLVARSVLTPQPDHKAHP